jgi:hypothetical protein
VRVDGCPGIVGHGKDSIRKAGTKLAAQFGRVTVCEAPSEIEGVPEFTRVGASDQLLEQSLSSCLCIGAVAIDKNLLKAEPRRQSVRLGVRLEEGDEFLLARPLELCFALQNEAHLLSQAALNDRVASIKSQTASFAAENLAVGRDHQESLLLIDARRAALLFFEALEQGRRPSCRDLDDARVTVVRAEGSLQRKEQRACDHEVQQWLSENATHADGS